MLAVGAGKLVYETERVGVAAGESVLVGEAVPEGVLDGVLVEVCVDVLLDVCVDVDVGEDVGVEVPVGVRELDGLHTPNARTADGSLAMATWLWVCSPQQKGSVPAVPFVAGSAQVVHMPAATARHPPLEGAPACQPDPPVSRPVCP